MSFPENITKARSHLILDHPFFATLLLQTKMIEDNTQPTLCTDGESIWYNTEFIGKLSLEESIFVLAHEALHCVLDHMGRREGRDAKKWNLAADYIINEILINDKVGKMPQVAVYDPEITRKGDYTTEGVFKLLPSDNKGNKGRGKGKDNGGPKSFDWVFDAGSDRGKKTPDPAEKSRLQNELKRRVKQAEHVARAHGKLGASVERLVGDLLAPKVDWKEVLRRFVNERVKEEPSWARPKRRFLGEDLYLPTLDGQALGKITVALDCSGSIDDKQIAEFTTEINAIRVDMGYPEIELIYFDHEVKKIEKIEKGDESELRLRAYKGGGTDFAPIFRQISEHNQPVALVVLTDLFCKSFGKITPDYPVLWCSVRGLVKGFDTVPFGEIVVMG